MIRESFINLPAFAPLFMLINFLTFTDWTLWSVLFIALLYALVNIVTTRSHNPESGPVFAVFLVTLGLMFSTATAVLLYWLVQQQSLTGLVVMTLLLAWPLVPLMTRTLSSIVKAWKRDHLKSPNENFSTPRWPAPLR